MTMTDGQFFRIDTIAGGSGASDRAFIRAAWSRLSAEGKSKEARALRHAWIRSGLAKRRKCGAMGI